MKPNRPSLTAHRVAMMRAAHQILDRPLVFEDPLALSILGIQGACEILLMKRKLKSRLHSYLRAMVVARSRFVEEELAAEIERGVRQYVILGAGLAAERFELDVAGDLGHQGYLVLPFFRAFCVATFLVFVVLTIGWRHRFILHSARKSYHKMRFFYAGRIVTAADGRYLN